LDGFAYSTEVRVRFAETDAQGIAHHSNYLVWFELARVAYLAEYTGGYQALRDEGYEATVVEAHARYLVPARFDDVIRIWLRCIDVRGARFRYEYVLERIADGVKVADGWTSHACVDARTLRPTRLPQWLKDAITAAEAGPTERPASAPEPARGSSSQERSSSVPSSSSAESSS
jgi:acyl-CoA thioester hydrolase